MFFLHLDRPCPLRGRRDLAVHVQAGVPWHHLRGRDAGWLSALRGAFPATRLTTSPCELAVERFPSCDPLRWTHTSIQHC